LIRLRLVSTLSASSVSASPDKPFFSKTDSFEPYLDEMEQLVFPPKRFPSLPVSPGLIFQRQCLTALFFSGSCPFSSRRGEISLNFLTLVRSLLSTVGDTRTEEDFVAHIRGTVASDPSGEWIFICDQLNTHKSEGLVRLVAQLCGLKEELGKKGSSGILHNMNSRATFLENKSHRIRFVYTPKHCSWLNQIEIWFGILSRRLLKRGNFSSTEELKNRILKFIEFFNETLAKPFRWTYIGKPLLI
jgi:hypothetical protein